MMERQFINKHRSRKKQRCHFSLFILTLIICVNIFGKFQYITADSAEQDKCSDNSPIALRKLDKIIELLEGLKSKLSKLDIQEQLVSEKPKDSKQAEAAEKINNNDEESNQASIKENNKRDSPTRHLFHFNKLALVSSSDSINSIPLSSPSWPSEIVSSRNSNTDNEQPAAAAAATTTTTTCALAEHKRMILLIGQHYEWMFAEALDNLNGLLKEQLAGLRFSLSKLTNRVANQNYQSNLVADQLALIKDECSLAASCATSLSLQQAAPSINSSAAFQQQQQQPAYVGLRSSDISAIVRLVAQELNRPSAKPFEEERVFEQRLEERLDGQRMMLSRRLDQLDSVVKQSALQINKLLQLNSFPGGQLTPNPQLKNQVELTYTNLDNSGGANASGKAAVTTTTATSTSRWSAGSKVPGRQPNEQPQRRQQLVEVQKQKCQSKSSLVKPTSCQELRLAGANCTGQYYVFVRGQIRHVYCEMSMDSEDDGGGWTVILRRIDKSLAQTSTAAAHSAPTGSSNQILELFKASQLSFDLDWPNYKSGFGHLMGDWGEFFIGLDLLHQLTGADNGDEERNQTIGSSGNNSQQMRAVAEHELQVDLETSDAQELHLRFQGFRVESDSAQFQLRVEGCNSSALDVCEPILSLDGARFYAPENVSADCSRQANQPPPRWGWWKPSMATAANGSVLCAAISDAGRNGIDLSTNTTILTSPIGRQPDGSSLHLYWPNWAHSAAPLRRIVLKVRRKRPKMVGTTLS